MNLIFVIISCSILASVNSTKDIVVDKNVDKKSVDTKTKRNSTASFVSKVAAAFPFDDDNGFDDVSRSAQNDNDLYNFLLPGSNNVRNSLFPNNNNNNLTPNFDSSRLEISLQELYFYLMSP
jgi:hypothetical protein